MTDTERHGPVPRRPAARLDRRTSYLDENQASQAKKPSKNDMPSPHRRRSDGPAAGMVTFRHSFPPQSMRRPYQKNAAKTGQKFLSKLNPNANPKKFSLNTVYGHFKKASGGCDGGDEGHNGSLNPICLFLIHMPSPHRRIFCHCSRERPAPATAQAAPRLGQGRKTLAMGPRRPTSVM